MTHSIEAIIEREHLRWDLQFKAVKTVFDKRYVPRPVITISRMLGSGAADIAKGVAEELKCRLLGIAVMDEVARKSKMRKALVDSMDERVLSRTEAWIERRFHNRTCIDSCLYHRHLLQVISCFMEQGNAVLLGRGASFLPRTQPRVDIRIIASLDNRVNRIMAENKCSKKKAMATIRTSDEQRALFVQELFGEDWWDTRQYDLIINTDNVDAETAVVMIRLAWENIHKVFMDYRFIDTVTAQS